MQARVLESPMNLLYAFLSSMVALRIHAEDGDSLTTEGSESPLGGQVGCPSRNSHTELSMHQEQKLNIGAVSAGHLFSNKWFPFAGRTLH